MPKKEDLIVLELDREINESLAPLCQTIAQEAGLPQEALLSPKAKAQTIENEMKAEINGYRKKCTEGFVLCVDEMQEIARKDPTLDLKVVKQNLEQAFDKLDSLDTIKNYVKEVLSGKTWRELLSISEPSLQALYKGAKHMFDEKRYREAESAFCFLATLDSSQYAFWLGLGHSCFHNKNFKEATNAYAMASMADSAAIWPHVYAANCFEATSDFHHALIALESAKKTSVHSQERNREFEEALNQRIVMLQRI